jgi:signal transduction histidine kinase
MTENKNLVIVIDDEESMRDSCRMILEKAGFRTETAENGLEGIRKVEELEPEIVLIDLKMPGIGGFEVLDRIRQINPQIIPIVITGYATVESAVEAMKRGAYDFLPKPFTPEELRLIINRGLERIKLAREAESLRREKKLIEENFITMVSHQLRSPLVAIMQYFETILAGMVGTIDPKPREMLVKARERLDQLMELINDWLDIARMNGGRIVHNQQPISMRELLREQLEILRPLADKDGVSLQLEEPRGSDLAAGDPETLGQVFANLLANAVKYNRPGGSVTARIREEEDRLAIDITDTGLGIPEEHIPYIFDQFYRIKRAGKANEKGSGLGLSIAKKIVEAHNGAIEVTSREGEGSTFTVQLPKVEAENHETA